MLLVVNGSEECVSILLLSSSRRARELQLCICELLPVRWKRLLPEENILSREISEELHGRHCSTKSRRQDLNEGLFRFVGMRLHLWRSVTDQWKSNHLSSKPHFCMTLWLTMLYGRNSSSERLTKLTNLKISITLAECFTLRHSARRRVTRS